jgi:uncharacterized Fe-S cluster-containing protein
VIDWKPPGKNCGACGFKTCEAFASGLETGLAEVNLCPFSCVENTLNSDKITKKAGSSIQVRNSTYSGTDEVGKEYDFVLFPFPGEPSARKFIVPFRADLVEKWDIKKGDLVTGRPAGPGCPLYHALRVLSANPLTGVLECHTVGPLVSRAEKVYDIQAYHVHAFEGIASVIRKAPIFGNRQYFLPANCMLGLAHTALVNMILQKSFGTHVRLEDVRIL